jgi:hypothetical protein
VISGTASCAAATSSGFEALPRTSTSRHRFIN